MERLLDFMHTPYLMPVPYYKARWPSLLLKRDVIIIRLVKIIMAGGLRLWRITPR